MTDCQETGIHRLSPKATNDVGWRHVSLATVLKKALNYMEAKQWSGNMAPIQVLPLAGGQLFGYITGHQRMVALHMVCVWFYMQSKTLPAWVKTMAQQVHFSVVVTSPETAAVHSLAGRLSEKLHATKWSYISICMMVNAKGMKLDDFSQQKALASTKPYRILQRRARARAQSNETNKRMNINKERNNKSIEDSGSKYNQQIALA